MKPAIAFLLPIMSMFPVLLTAQAPEKSKTYRNEVGVGFTSLIQQFFFVNTSDYYEAPHLAYFVTYKRLMKQYNFRFGLGGNGNAREYPDKQLPDQIDNSSFSNIDFRIGLEKNAQLTKRWNFHYGFDFRISTYKSHRDRSFSGGGFAFGYDTHEQRLAVAPTLMIEFKISQRLSLQTETNFAVYFRRYENAPFVTQIEAHPSSPVPTTVLDEDREFGADFTIPLFLILAAKI